MIPRFPALTVVAALLVAPELAGAQTTDDKPKDVKRPALTIDPFDVDSAECGVDGGRLTDALGREAKASPIRFDGSVHVFRVPMATLAQPARPARESHNLGERKDPRLRRQDPRSRCRPRHGSAYEGFYRGLAQGRRIVPDP